MPDIIEQFVVRSLTGIELITYLRIDVGQGQLTSSKSLKLVVHSAYHGAASCATAHVWTGAKYALVYDIPYPVMTARKAEGFRKHDSDEMTIQWLSADYERLLKMSSDILGAIFS